MLATTTGMDDRVWQFVRGTGALHASAEEIANQVDCDVRDAQAALDDMVARNLLRRFDVPGRSPVYWS